MKLKDKFTELMHNQALKRKLYVIIFEADVYIGKILGMIISVMCENIETHKTVKFLALLHGFRKLKS